MKHTFKKILSLTVLFGTGLVLAENCCNTGCDNDCDDNITSVTTCYLPRSQSRNIVYKTAGLDPDHEHLPDMDCLSGTFNIGVEYTQSFSNDNIARCLFGPAVVSNTATSSSSSSTSSCATSCNNDCDDSVTIRVVGTGATTPANGTTDLVAQNFFLPNTFSSSITFSPRISNINVPLHLYLGLDEWCDGMYLRIYGPITNTRWKLEANENVISGTPTGNVAAGLISPVAVPNTSLYQSFLSYTSGNSITLPTSTPAVKVDPLVRQKIFSGCESRTKTGFADLRAELGWDFLLDECYHLGINIQGAAPTGNHCSECFLFGPIIGNGHHWELGGGVTGHYTFWRSEDYEQEFGLYVDADITHIFKHAENRVFDLKNKPLSRYIYAQKMTKADPLLIVGTSTPTLQFGNEWAPVANFAVQNVNVSYDVQGDVLAKFVYTCRGFSWEVGYNFWGRSCQKVELDCDCGNQFPSNSWALTNEQVFGFDQNNNTIHAIAATNSNISAFNFPTTWDNEKNIVTYNNAQLLQAPTGSPADSNGSNPVVTIQQSDLDISNGARGISNKVFTHFNYTWIDCEDWIPYLGFGASAEFGSTKNRGSNGSSSSSSSSTSSSTTGCCDTSCDTDCNSCPNCSLSQWSVWLKGGVSFN